jgi:hypothetical protein
VRLIVGGNWWKEFNLCEDHTYSPLRRLSCLAALFRGLRLDNIKSPFVEEAEKTSGFSIYHRGLRITLGLTHATSARQKRRLIVPQCFSLRFAATADSLNGSKTASVQSRASNARSQNFRRNDRSKQILVRGFSDGMRSKWRTWNRRAY